jgi:CubicO group peptidase (beta-lactamase class C family)
VSVVPLSADERVPLPAQPSDRAWPTFEWPRAEPDARVDRVSLDALLDEAFGQSELFGQTNALLIAQGGAVVVERYAEAVDEKTPHISWSMSKSFLHAVMGLLVRDGRLDLEAPADVPVWSDSGDPRSAITVDQLLRMRSGLRFIEDYVDAETSDVIEMLFGSGKKDVARFAADFPLESEPGTVWSYSSGTTNILAGIAHRIVSSDPGDLLGFVERELFEPLGIRSATIRSDDVGTWIASSFVFATARDFARFGLLYLRDGIWEGRRLLPPGWVDRARIGCGTPESESFDYGSHFWVVPESLGTFQAQGFNGQRITIVPGLDLVVVRLGVTRESKSERLNEFMKQLVDAFRPTRG